MVRGCMLAALLGGILGCAADLGAAPDARSALPPLSDFVRPMDEWHVIFGFALRNPDFDDRYHCAEDLLASPGAPVYAATDGEIAYAGPMDGYGWLVVVDHPRRFAYSLYGHLSTRRAEPLFGPVAAGQEIGTIADEDEDAHSGRPHLHFGIRAGLADYYPDYGDSRWMAGYTAAYPTELGWQAPSEIVGEAP